ncbi:MAG TPA: hypothetical protein VMG35_19600 [Bryobacteraceae bacterium]|nr:hypothetical protein [Bryobacteraceae bacterium]
MSLTRLQQRIVFAVTVVAAVAGIFILPAPYQLWTIVVLLIWIVAIVLIELFRARPVVLKFAENEQQLESAWRYGDRVYKDMNKEYPPLVTVLAWWKKFRHGTIRLLDTKTQSLLAYFSIWPISGEVYARLKDGTMPETALTPDHLKPHDPPFEHWYIADICRRRIRNCPRKFNEYLVHALISGAFRLLKREGDLAKDFFVIAHAATLEGENLLKRHGFFKEHPSTLPAGIRSIWTGEFNTDALPNLLKRHDDFLGKYEKELSNQLQK